MPKQTDVAKIANCVAELMLYAEKKLSLNPDDGVYVRNLLLAKLKVPEPEEPAVTCRPIQTVLDEITDYAVRKKLTTEQEKLLFETKIMGILTPMPSAVIKNFDDVAAESGVKAATKYLFDLSVANNYIRKVDIDKNIGWEVPTEKGSVKITINLAKPEKDPKAVLAASKAPQTNYPKCPLCVENVGWWGNLQKPARQTLRAVPLFLNDEKWWLQFSPYVYFDNHCICFSDEHRPMHLDVNSFKRMADFVDTFPHYFIGSNAPLPIVGGSILAHDHYQGGAKVLPEMKTACLKKFRHPDFEGVTAGIADWYNSVVRIEGSDAEKVIALTNHVFETWKTYSDKTVDILAFTDETPHNTVTPVAQKTDDGNYRFDLILRNNRTDEKHPYGIFHPTEDMHNIKKEAIGIIEVMGLFILPGRLAKEAVEIRKYLTGETPLNFKELSDPEHPLFKHVGMIAQLANDNGLNLSEGEAGDVITDYINKTCIKILETTAVFKADQKGRKAFDRFMTKCGFEEE